MLCQQGGCTRYWQGTQPRQLTKTNQWDIPQAWCSVHKLGTADWEGPFTAQGLTGHRSADGEQPYCASLLSLGFYFSLFLLDSFCYISIHFCYYYHCCCYYYLLLVLLHLLLLLLVLLLVLYYIMFYLLSYSFLNPWVVLWVFFLLILLPIPLCLATSCSSIRMLFQT